MDRIDVSQILDPAKQQPFLGTSLEFLQNAIAQADNFIGRSMAGDSYSASIAYIVYGGRDTAGVIADGFIFFDDEWYYLAGADTTAYANVPVIIASNSNGAADPITFTDGSTGNVHNVRQVKIADQTTGTGLADYADAVFFQDTIVRSEVAFKIKTMDIGDWNMDATTDVTFAHGLTGANIRSVDVIIRDDVGAPYTKLDMPHQTTASSFNEMEGYYVWSDTVITLVRRTTGRYDDIAYNATSYNRGWVTFHYVL